MRVVCVNSYNCGSTGTIMLQVAETVRKAGGKAVACYPKSRSNTPKQKKEDLLIGNRISRNIHVKLAYITGLNGMFSVFSTVRFLRKVDQYKPDIIHLHNLHNCYINLPLLFHYLKRKAVPVVWTLHDCWSITGKCPHFTMVKCGHWQGGCYHCQQVKSYPASFVDQSRLMWKLKKKWFTGVPNMIIITPSQWLSDLVEKSYLKEYQVRVINNGIDLTVFHPTDSDFRIRYGISRDKPILLGVAFDWGKRKGLDVFLKLAEDLGDAYQIVLVGTNEHVDAQLPASIISIHRTQNQRELAEIYSAADIFINPTREDTFPTVNIESLACGTPVITFATGGSPEILDDTCGMVVPCDDVPALENAIHHVIQDKPFSKKACRKRAEQFDMNDKFAEYVALYRELCGEKQ